MGFSLGCRRRAPSGQMGGALRDQEAIPGEPRQPPLEPELQLLPANGALTAAVATPDRVLPPRAHQRGPRGRRSGAVAKSGCGPDGGTRRRGATQPYPWAAGGPARGTPRVGSMWKRRGRRRQSGPGAGRALRPRESRQLAAPPQQQQPARGSARAARAGYSASGL